MTLKVDFAEENRVIDLTFAEQIAALGVQFEQVMKVKADADPYTGDYTVTPKVDGSILKTKDKYMTKDVTVHPIPIFNVSNTAGGTTVYIAKEAEENGNI